LYRHYHDDEWGAQAVDDRRQFEFLVLESAQAGLSWLTILNKRENYRRAYDGFDVEKVARYDEAKVAELLADAGIVRNRRKIEASVSNAARFIEIQREFGSFAAYLGGFTGGKVVVGKWDALSELPAHTALSDCVAADMKKRGFRFLGSTIMYSHMQATGLVNDHLTGCFRYSEINDANASGLWI
jgi:DNA-3-methyladenine glycosylase I